jgi:hypothetical protein
MDLIWGKGERIYFCQLRWTAELPICPSGKSHRVDNNVTCRRYVLVSITT